jgi:RNA polymerase sigma-70 factor, ECF subfamily
LANTTDLAARLPDLLPKQWTFAWRITGDRLDAEELTQKTCLRARQRVEPGMRGMRPLCTVYAIAYRIWVDELRLRRAHERFDHASPLQRAESDALSQRIVAAVDQLPHAQRIAMLLVAIEALRYAEAAQVLAVPVNTVMGRVVRARQTLGRQFAARPDQYGKTAAR